MSAVEGSFSITTNDDVRLRYTVHGTQGPAVVLVRHVTLHHGLRSNPFLVSRLLRWHLLFCICFCVHVSVYFRGQLSPTHVSNIAVCVRVCMCVCARKHLDPWVVGQLEILCAQYS